MLIFAAALLDIIAPISKACIQVAWTMSWCSCADVKL